MRKRAVCTFLALSILGTMTVYAGQWQKNGTNWSYIQDNGQPVKEGWYQDTDGKVYNFNGGVTRAGWYLENGKYYYFSPTSGERMSGLFNADGNTYFCGPQGVMQTGWFQVNGKWYHAKDNGVLDKGLTDINKCRFYFYPDGHMAVNEWVEEGKYFATLTGEIATDQWLDNENYANGSGKVSDGTSTVKSSDKKKLQNKVYSDAEYMSMLEDHLVRYGDQCEALMGNINMWRMTYNEENVYNYEGDDDDYFENHELDEFINTAALNRAATLRAMELASQERAAGARPNGKDWETVVEDCNAGTFTRLVESVAFGQSDSEDAYEDLEVGSNHQAYWRDKKYTHIGVGAACDVSGKMYWVVIYGQ